MSHVYISILSIFMFVTFSELKISLNLISMRLVHCSMLQCYICVCRSIVYIKQLCNSEEEEYGIKCYSLIVNNRCTGVSGSSGVTVAAVGAWLMANLWCIGEHGTSVNTELEL